MHPEQRQEHSKLGGYVGWKEGRDNNVHDKRIKQKVLSEEK